MNEITEVTISVEALADLIDMVVREGTEYAVNDQVATIDQARMWGWFTPGQDDDAVGTLQALRIAHAYAAARARRVSA